MNRLVATAAIGLCLGAAAVPAWAQANGGLNPCLKNVHADGGANGFIFGGHAATDIPISDDDCWRLQRANLAALLAVNSHDPAEQRQWAQATRGVWCAIADNRMNAPELCNFLAAPMVKADPPATAPQVSQTSKSIPHPAPVAVMAALSDPSPPRDPTPPKLCLIPDGVPASQWSGCWYNK